MFKLFLSFRKEIVLIGYDYWLMLITLFFMKIGQFMLFPFLTIYLINYSNLSPIVIGFIIGIGPIVYGMAGLLGVVFIDDFGVKKALVFSLFFGGLSLCLFFNIHSVAWYASMNILTGASRCIFDIGSKSYRISDFSVELRKTCFSLRFMTVNSAAAIGPAIGAYFAFHNALFSFKVTGILYFLLGLMSWFFLKETKAEKSLSFIYKRVINIFDPIKIIYQDNSLRILLIISFIFWVIYSQLDSTLAEYLHAELTNGVEIYSLLLIINAIGCASLQLIITQVTKNISDYILSLLSMLTFAISYAVLALFINLPSLVIAAIIIVIGESIIMPLNDLLLTKIAPPNRIGAYYGVISLSMLGLGFGPMLGGIIYQYFNAKFLFLSISSICLLTIILYKSLLNSINCKSGSSNEMCRDLSIS